VGFIDGAIGFGDDIEADVFEPIGALDLRRRDFVRPLDAHAQTDSLYCKQSRRDPNLIPAVIRFVELISRVGGWTDRSGFKGRLLREATGGGKNENGWNMGLHHE
jgi:hypothetical protein